MLGKNFYIQANTLIGWGYSNDFNGKAYRLLVGKLCEPLSK